MRLSSPTTLLRAQSTCISKRSPNGRYPLASSVRKDIRAFVRTYAPTPRAGRASLDDVLDCPLRELGLVSRSAATSRLRFVIGPKSTLPDEIVGYAVFDYLARREPAASTVTLARLASEAGGPGRAFKLLESDLHAALTAVSESSTDIHLLAPTGTQQLSWSSPPAEIAVDLLNRYYGVHVGDLHAGTRGDRAGRGGRAFLPGARSRPTHAGVGRGEDPVTTLDQLLTVPSRFARSVNVERDVTQTEPLEGYVVTARALDVAERIATTASQSSAGGAWSITGPYGSGKSALAVLIDGAFGPAGRVRKRTLDLIGEVSPEVAAAIDEAHRRHGTSESGFNRAVATASREPVSATILRALHSGVLRRFGKMPGVRMFPAARTLSVALSEAASGDPRRTGPSPSALLEVAHCLAANAPLLVVVDEFGKNLEAVAQSNDSDPYLLQQLAEAGQGAGAPIFTLTLQHLSFEDYFLNADGPQQREWAKVQGRFEDIPYVDSPEQTRSLIGTVFKITEPDLRSRVDRWATQAADAASRLGIADLAEPAVVAACYPLHPLTAAVLPELCSRYGQNERTLFSFLTGPDRAGVPSVLACTPLEASGDLPVIGLPEVYDYFVDGGVIGRTGRGDSRAAGPRSRPGFETRTVSRIVRATWQRPSPSSIWCPSRARCGLPVTWWSWCHRARRKTLAELQSLGLVTYRRFADEYRLWQGSDVDLRRLLDHALEQISHLRLVDILKSVGDPSPVVAARHSARHDILRIFSRRYVHGDEGH